MPIYLVTVGRPVAAGPRRQAPIRRDAAASFGGE